MGNQVASEGEDMAESPRVAIGEISKKKRKHRSFRKRMMDKFKKSKLDIPQREYKEDPPKVPQSPQDVNRRRNYYKHLGIVQKGSNDNENSRLGTTKMMSCLDFPRLESDLTTMNNKSAMIPSSQNEEYKYDDGNTPAFNRSLSSIAMCKGKAIASGNLERYERRGKMTSSKSSSNLHSNTRYRIEQATKKKRDRSESPKFGSKEDKTYEMSTRDTGTNKTSMAESINENTEEEKCTTKLNDKDTEGFKIDVMQTQTTKTVSDMRKKFLSKLTQEKIWLTPSEKPKSHQTCIIFDWDDTLLCTTFLNPTNAGNFDLPLNVKLQLKKLEKAAFNILSECINYGDVYIITNAADGWVEFSTRKYMPKLLKILPKVKVMSARAICEDEHPDEVHQWKMKAFLKTACMEEKGAITNLIALGDSQFEMDAVKHLGTQFPRALLKTIKFREMPSPDELVKQINLVLMKLDQICTSAKNLTIRLERKENE